MLKNTHIWLAEYIWQCVAERCPTPGTAHIIFCVADHFEPRWVKVGLQKELERVDTFILKYEKVASGHSDRDGKRPQHTFFYPIDEFTPEVFERLSRFCEKGYGEIEIHLHHDNDTADSLRKKLEDGKALFGKTRYGFIHGNWSLGNSRRDGRWCGVNNELAVLRDTGCYADFTLPSAPSDTQTRKINSIYYARDTARPKPHNCGADVRVGPAPDGGLMIIQGPLTLNWRRRKYGVLPRIENAEITLANPPTPDRVDLWISQLIRVLGRPEWTFVKVHAHGAQDDNLQDVYFRNLDTMFGYLEDKYNDGVKYKLHYVTAREMYNIVKAAEAGERGDPGSCREYEIVSNIDRRPQTEDRRPKEDAKRAS